MPEPLSIKQKEIFIFLKNEIRRKGYPPTVREICESVGLKSTSTVHTHLSSLEKKGYIRRSPTKNRSIEILEDNFYGFSDQIINVPIIKQITSFDLILSEDNIEGTFPIPSQYLSGSDVFILIAKGESMINAGIFNNDLIVINQQTYANNGDIVLAWVDDSATLKYFFKETGHIRLQPANPAFVHVMLKDCKIIGKAVGVYRKI